MGNSAPNNYLICDGTVYNISNYTKLADYFNTQFGSKNKFGGNGTTTFAVPDLRGEFLRGNGTNGHVNYGSGGTVGEHQNGTSIVAVYSVNQNKFQIAFPSGEALYQRGDLVSGQPTTSIWTNVATNGAGGSYNNPVTLTRPTNTSVLYCICYK